MGDTSLIGLISRIRPINQSDQSYPTDQTDSDQLPAQPHRVTLVYTRLPSSNHLYSGALKLTM